MNGLIRAHIKKKSLEWATYESLMSYYLELASCALFC